MKFFSDNAGFLGYTVNISFPTDKIPYSQICGTKVGTSYKERRQRFRFQKVDRPKTMSYQISEYTLVKLHTVRCVWQNVSYD